MEKQYVKTERAHFMCPNMHFGIVAEVNAGYFQNKAQTTLDWMAEAHPFLKSVMQYGEDGSVLFYSICEASKIEMIQRNGTDQIEEDYKMIGRSTWNIFEKGLLKVFFYPEEESFHVLFVAHHLLGDGRCLLALVNEFTTSYVEERKPVYREEKLIKGFEDLPTHSNLPIVSSYLIRRLNKKWKQENVRVSYEEYLKFEETFTKENEVFMKSGLIEEAKLKSLKISCKENDITINDLLMGAMYLTTKSNKMVIAVDLRKKLTCYKEGTLGNYASAMSIVTTDTSKEIIQKAQNVHKRVQAKIMKNRSIMLVISCYLTMTATLIDAVAIATLGTFNSKTARFVGEKMFGFQKRDGISITNLGKLENPYIKKAMFFPPASPAMAQTLGVVTVNDKLHLCNCYYEKQVSAGTVGTQFEEMLEVLNLHKLRMN